MNDIIEPNIIRKAVELGLSDAKQKAESAGYSGAWHDGGSSAIINEITIFGNLWNGEPIHYFKIPKLLQVYIKQAEKELDSDYSLYIKLKQKFER